MVNIRTYGAGVVTGLVSLSQGTCYWPGCPEAIVRIDDGRPVVNFEIAHIRAANHGGRRYDPAMTDEERNDFPNLVLLCMVHHKIVDKLRPEDFPRETLQGWKTAREASGVAALQGLRGLTEERLQEMLTDSYQTFKEQFDHALKGLEQVDLEAAKLLRPLIDELTQARFHARFPDSDTAVMLVDAARELAHLQDTAVVLSGAAKNLGGLQDTAEVLSSAAREFRRTQGFM